FLHIALSDCNPILSGVICQALPGRLLFPMFHCIIFKSSPMSERTENAMNIYDISKKAGVSIATVSRVLNDSAKVSAATRQRVLDVIRETNYMPNAFARSLGLNSMYTVGLLCSDPSDVYQAQAVCYLERELRNHSYTSMLCCTGGRLEE